MSKLGILKSLPTPSELRQSVQELSSLEQLPDLVAQEVSKSLEPLLTLRQDVTRVLEAYDVVTKAQRSSLESMAKDMTDRSTSIMEAKTWVLDKTIQDLANQLQGLKSSMANMETSSKGMQALPKTLASAATAAATTMQSSSQELARQVERVRPSVWRTLGQMLGAAILGALLVAAGQVGLNKILPPSDLQQKQNENAEIFRILWSKATPKERELMNQIVVRPDK